MKLRRVMEMLAAATAILLAANATVDFAITQFDQNVQKTPQSFNASATADPRFVQTESRQAVIEVLIAVRNEIATARELLSSPELSGDPGFIAYLQYLDVATAEIDDAEIESSGTMTIDQVGRMGVALGQGRSRLAAEVSTLPGWLAVSRATGVRDRFAPVPKRFIQERGEVIQRAPDFNDDDITTWLDLNPEV